MPISCNLVSVLRRLVASCSATLYETVLFRRFYAKIGKLSIRPSERCSLAQETIDDRQFSSYHDALIGNSLSFYVSFTTVPVASTRDERSLIRIGA